MSTNLPEPQPVTGTDAATFPSAGPSLARRRLLRGGLGAAPVLLAAAPRSVMAGNCVAASAQTSYSPMQATSHQPTMYSCMGKTPDYWRDNVWPVSCPYVKTAVGTTPATKVNDIFSAWPATSYGDMTLQSVLGFTDTSGERCMVRYMVAGMLNAASYAMPDKVASAPILKGIWAEYWSRTSNRHYVPTAGVKWYCDYSTPRNSGGITPWLKSTMSG
jgi:hypothetical protein